MLNVFRSLLDIVVNLVNFVINTITSLINFILNIPNYINVLTASIGYLPTVFIPFALASVSVYVVLFLIDRR